MNRKERRALMHEQHSFVRALPPTLTPIPPEEVSFNLPVMPVRAWRSRKYLVQLFAEVNPDYPALARLSICRVKLSNNGRWEDGLSWDELQAIKAEVGFGNWYGMEIYPPDANVINIANFRHLWLLPKPLPIGWF